MATGFLPQTFRKKGTIFFLKDVFFFFFNEKKWQTLGCDWKILDVSCEVVGCSRKVRKAWSKRRKELIASRSSVKKNWSGSSDFHVENRVFFFLGTGALPASYPPN